MTLAIDAITISVRDPDDARRFYSSLFGLDGDETPRGAEFGLPGAGRLQLTASDGVASFAGAVVSAIFAQPADVEAFLTLATAAGATLLVPGKKSLFAGYSGVVRAPDGAVWKAATAVRKDSRPASAVPRPDDLVILLGTAEPKRSRDFAVALGMKTDRDYGNKYVDLLPRDGSPRLGYMPAGALAKDAGVAGGATPGAIGVRGEVGTEAELVEVLASAERQGAAVASRSDLAAVFLDPDGFPWTVRVGRRE